MSKENLSELQKHLLEMLKWFHSFCVENDLSYYILYGTMLGAARHAGFIPWDDDVDVGMPRKDYEKLCRILGNKQVSHYLLETPYSKAKEYCFPISKLYDTRTTLIEHKRYQVKRGVFIDVFPLDGIGNTIDESYKHFHRVDNAYKFLLTRMCGVRKGRSFGKNLVVLLMRCIPQVIINDKKLLQRLDALCKKYEFGEMDYVASLLGAYGSREIMLKETLGTPKLYQFEDTVVYGVENPDQYLTHLYREWRKLPPEDRRVTHHDFTYLSLDESYLQKLVDSVHSG